MNYERNNDYLIGLVRELCKLPNESGWVEFKHNNADPHEIGEYISALSNSAALVGKTMAYLVWGVDDKTHDIIGTTFVPSNAKMKGQELESWLLQNLAPKIRFHFYEFIVDEQPIVLLEIERAFRHPVQFSKIEYIRIGSYKKSLKDFPDIERDMWRIFDHIPFEKLLAFEEANNDDVLRLLDYPAYFDLLGLPLPSNAAGILHSLEEEEMIVKSQSGKWNITNFGAILFAKKLSDFASLGRKAMRVIQYKGNSHVETIKEQTGMKGYASGFEGLIGYINGLLPSNEVIGKALRKTVPMYPELAIRELIANALIHQDFEQRGTGPMVEIFDDRMEIINPGLPLVTTERFLDSPPKSRNEMLASFMRRIGVCEERGSGVDKVVFETEYFQLPAPLFETTNEHTRAILFAHKTLNKMDKADRIRACYLHACLRHVNREYMTNTTVRERFGIATENKAIASRLIKEALDAQVIKADDENAAPKLRRYSPFWA